MKQLIKTSSFIVYICAAFILLGSQAIGGITTSGRFGILGDDAEIKELSIGNRTGSINSKISLPIKINDPRGVGGTAFTIKYDPKIFEFKGLESAAKSISDGSEYIVEGSDPVEYEGYTPQDITDTIFFQYNNEKENGRVLVAAARAVDFSDLSETDEPVEPATILGLVIIVAGLALQKWGPRE